MSNILNAAAELMEAQEAELAKVTVEDILKLIKQHTFGCMVAGGYCRDVFHGVIPKDVDVCVYNFYMDDGAELMLLGMLWTSLLKFNVKNLSEGHIDYGGDERIEMVWHIPHLSLDLIFYNHCRTYLDVIRKFDFNLNQFYLPSTVPDKCWDGEIEYNPSLDESPVYVGEYPLGELWQLKDDLTDERKDHILGKFSILYPDSEHFIRTESDDDDYIPY